MSDTSSSRELYEEIHQRTVGKYGIIEVPSDKARDLVERVVAADSSHESLLGAIELLASALPQDQDRSKHLMTLFNKVVSVGSYTGERLIHGLFYRNPDALAEPLIDFVRGDPMGQRRTKLLTDIFNPAILRRDAVECYPPESYDQEVRGLKRAAAGIDKLRTKQGVLAIVEGVITSHEAERAAKEQHRSLFYS